MSKKEKVILGVVTGAVVGVFLEILRGNEAWLGISVGWKASIAGLFGVILFSLLAFFVKKLKQGDARKI